MKAQKLVGAMHTRRCTQVHHTSGQRWSDNRAQHTCGAVPDAAMNAIKLRILSASPCSSAACSAWLKHEACTDVVQFVFMGNHLQPCSYISGAAWQAQANASSPALKRCTICLTGELLNVGASFDPAACNLASERPWPWRLCDSDRMPLGKAACCSASSV